MKTTKFLICILLLFIAVFPFVGCSPEDIINKATDGAVDFDKDGNITPAANYGLPFPFQAYKQKFKKITNFILFLPFTLFTPLIISYSI